MKPTNVFEGVVKLRVFPLSLAGEARHLLFRQTKPITD